jgi:starch synthase
LPIIDCDIHFNSVCYIEDWINETKGDFYFLREVINEDYTRSISASSTMCFGFQIVENSKNNYKLAMEKSFSRLFSDFNSGKNIDNYHISLQLKYILDKMLPLTEFMKWYVFTTEKLQRYNISFNTFYKRLSYLKNNDVLATKFYHYLNYVVVNYNSINDSIYKSIDSIVKEFDLGPICFATPEIGRWSTIGGLGVMVIYIVNFR